jgi:hypothetical protein
MQPAKISLPFFSLKRFAIYAAALGFAHLVGLAAATGSTLASNADFTAFYSAGRLFNESPDLLYDVAAQQREVIEVEPKFPTNAYLPFVNPPFVIAIFGPLAHLPYLWAYLLWCFVTSILYFGGLRLLLTATPHIADAKSLYLLAFGFIPFHFNTLLNGQLSAIGFFFVALAIVLERQGKLFLSGLALVGLLYKLPLLLLILPMIVITRRFRTLAGFVVGAMGLVLASLTFLRPHLWVDYVRITRWFAHNKTTYNDVFETASYVDMETFFHRLIAKGNIRFFVTTLTAFVLAVLVIIAWRRAGRASLAWAISITWGLVLNVYVPIHDTILLFIAGPILIESYLRADRRVPTIALFLMALLYVCSWVALPLSIKTGWIMTLALVAFGCILNLAPVESRSASVHDTRLRVDEDNVQTALT